MAGCDLPLPRFSAARGGVMESFAHGRVSLWTRRRRVCFLVSLQAASPRSWSGIGHYSASARSQELSLVQITKRHRCEKLHPGNTLLTHHCDVDISHLHFADLRWQRHRRRRQRHTNRDTRRMWRGIGLRDSPASLRRRRHGQRYHGLLTPSTWMHCAASSRRASVSTRS